MKLEEVINTVKDFFTEHVYPVYRITSIVTEEKAWEVEVEVIEEKEYMKKYGRDQLLGVYQARVNEDMDVVSFHRKSLRYRAERIEESEGR
ncbi:MULTISPECIES: gas vesicle protein GvpO [Alteribacter]|uniref:Gas vesicle protein GvpR n=1 Tax=Alteribacter keqinensis TaxID=2483800 RepID=A0A3M7TSM8_9BACI|nr:MULTISPECIES: gas vesicle protein GvpO [Alteribacter]MBM7095648.1 gas vesicle protein [Alteribacter salitolerans]RNA67762.1 gas vesicle protein GvpR [Alteribacter keqinensis]